MTWGVGNVTQGLLKRKSNNDNSLKELKKKLKQKRNKKKANTNLGR